MPSLTDIVLDSVSDTDRLHTSIHVAVYFPVQLSILLVCDFTADVAKYRVIFIRLEHKGEGKAISLQAWSGLEGSRKLKFPDYTTTAQDGGKVVSPTHRPPLPPRNAPGTHFC